MKTHFLFRLSAYLLLLSGISFFYSCEKKESEPPVIYLPQEFKDYIYFKTGTYWVYEDSASAELDSSYVISDSLFIDELEIDNEVVRKEETFIYMVASNMTTKIYEYDGSTTTTTPDKCTNACFLAHRNIQNADAGTYILFYKPFIGEKKKPNGLTEVTLTHVYDSLEVAGKVYRDVIRMHETRNASENNKETVFYIAKRYGIIRKEINRRNATWEPDNWQVWNLVRSHSIQ